MNANSIAHIICPAPEHITAMFLAVRRITIAPPKIAVVLRGNNITLTESAAAACNPDSDSIIYYRFKDSKTHLVAMLVDGKHYAVTKFSPSQDGLIIEGMFDTDNQTLTNAVLRSF